MKRLALRGVHAGAGAGRGWVQQLGGGMGHLLDCSSFAAAVCSFRILVASDSESNAVKRDRKVRSRASQRGMPPRSIANNSASLSSSFLPSPLRNDCQQEMDTHTLTQRWGRAPGQQHPASLLGVVLVRLGRQWGWQAVE